MRSSVSFSWSQSRRKYTYRTQPPSTALNIASLSQFDIRTPIPKPIDSQSRQRDQILFRLFIGKLDIKHSMSDLFDYYASCAERGLLRAVAGQDESLGIVGDTVGSDGWVVGDLFNEEGGG